MLAVAWSLLTSRLAGPIATVAALGLAVALGVTTLQKAGLERDVAKHEATIARVSADLRTCRGNTATLEKAIAERNAEIQRISEAGAAQLAKAEAEIATARQETARLNTRINRLLTTPVTGSTVCERVEQVDRSIIEAFQ